MKNYFIIALLFSLNSCFSHKNPKIPKNDPSVSATNDPEVKEEIRNDLKQFYDEFDLEGMFVLYNPLKKKLILYNKSLYNQYESPASTFNITNTLIALDEKSIKDEHSIMKWNGRKYSNPIAAQDLDLATAFKNNIDWYFWRLRLRTGAKKINHWLEKLQYGNKVFSETIDSFRVTSLGLDSFWVVSGTLQITPAQQLQYIQDLYYNKLPFSKRSMDIVRNLMFEKDSAGCKIYGKRGSYRLNSEAKFIGWFAGYIETPDGVYFFVNYLQTPKLEHKSIVNAQKQIAFNIFQYLGLYGKEHP